MAGKYKQTLSPDSPDVELLTPAKTANPYYAEFGWLAADPAVRLPDAHTLWTVKGRELTDKRRSFWNGTISRA